MTTVTGGPVALRTAKRKATPELPHAAPLDLRELFPNYKTQLEEGGNPADPTDWILLARDGHFYIHSGTLLGVATDRSGPLLKRLIALPCIRSAQIGDDGGNFQFPLEDFATVAKIIKPRTRRKLTPEHRAKLLAAGCKHRFAGSKRDSEGQGRNVIAPGDSGQPAEIACEIGA